MNQMNNHPTREEDFDLYALGALEGDEKLAIESHVSGCSECGSPEEIECHGVPCRFVVLNLVIYLVYLCIGWHRHRQVPRGDKGLYTN